SGDEFATGAGRRPVVHFLDALVDRIGDDGQTPTQVRVVSGLLEYLANGGDRRGLAWVDFAFRQRPVVVTGSMDQRDLDGLGRFAAARPPQHRARGIDGP